MTAIFSTLSAIAEILNLAADLLLLLVGIQAARTILDVLDRMLKAWLWVAGLAQLVLMLACSLIADYGPAAGRILGRAAGMVYRWGRKARTLYDSHLQPLMIAADYAGRRFVESQAGNHAIADWAAPAVLVLVTEPQQVPQNRRELLALAKAVGLPNYSRIPTSELRAALA